MKGEITKTYTLDETWELCLEMWKWITKEWDGEEWVPNLKYKWTKKKDLEDILHSDCFFCDYASKKNGICEGCPGKLVDPEFDCGNDTYHRNLHPNKFLAKIVELNKIRKGEIMKIKGKDYSEETIQNALEAYIKAEPEPEPIKHGQAGFWTTDKDPRLFIWNKEKTKVLPVNQYGFQARQFSAEATRSNYTLFPNLDIFADLKQWATDCEEGYVNGFHVEAMGLRAVSVGGKVFSPEKAIKLANLIKQVVHTRLRKDKK